MVYFQNIFVFILTISIMYAPIFVVDYSNLFEENQVSKRKKGFLYPLMSIWPITFVASVILFYRLTLPQSAYGNCSYLSFPYLYVYQLIRRPHWKNMCQHWTPSPVVTGWEKYSTSEVSSTLLYPKKRITLV